MWELVLFQKWQSSNNKSILLTQQQQVRMYLNLEPNQLVFVATKTENERKTEQKRIEVATKFHSNSHTPGQQAQEITILLLVKIQPIFLTQLYEVISIPNSNLKFA